MVNGPDSLSGTVEIYYNGQFGTICDDDWDNNDAGVVCRQLGYHLGGLGRQSAYYGRGGGDILLDDVACDGSETNVADCGHLGWLSHNCDHGEDAGVTCGK